MPVLTDLLPLLLQASPLLLVILFACFALWIVQGVAVAAFRALAAGRAAAKRREDE